MKGHEEAWRLAATLVNIRSRHCRYRICRRQQFCDGPIQPSAHQSGVIRGHKEIGPSGTACAGLPMFMANATADYYAYVRGVSEKLTDLRNGELKHRKPWEFLHLIQNGIRNQHRNARHT